LVKFSEGPTVNVGTDDITFTLCSVRAREFFKLKVPFGYCADLGMYCLHLLTYSDSLIPLCYLHLFCAQGVAVVVSRSLELL
jgi:hypothetical protein